MSDAKVELLAMIDSLDALIVRADTLVEGGAPDEVDEARYAIRDARDTLSEAVRQMD